MTNPTIELRTEKNSLIAGERQTVDLLVRITPPDPDPNGNRRPRLNLAVALDRSGSMRGEKIHEAREAAKFCVDQLTSTDRFSTVIFDDQVDVLFTNQFVRDRESLKRGIDRIDARNATAMHEGWVKAGIQVSEAIDSSAVNRVLLITDGQANHGETNPDRIVSQAGEVASRGVTTSTIGIGRDFNEDLLMPMAEAGGGNAWHVERPSDMAQIFETELHGLVRQFATNVQLEIEAAEGVRVTECLNDFKRGHNNLYDLPTMLAGSELDVVFRLEISADAALHEQKALLRLRFKRRDTGNHETVSAAFEVAFASRSEVAEMSSDPAVIEAVQLLNNARARREAVEYIDRGDYAESSRLLKSAIDITQAACNVSPSAAFLAEIDDLNELRKSLEDRTDILMSRKRASYSREARRKGHVATLGSFRRGPDSVLKNRGRLNNMSRRGFIEPKGFTCANWYWSWSFVDHDRRRVLFGAWDDHVTNGRARIFSDAWEYNPNGKRQNAWSQSREHIRLVEDEGYQLFIYKMICANPEEANKGNGPRRILGFEPDIMPVTLIRDQTDWIAVF